MKIKIEIVGKNSNATQILHLKEFLLKYNVEQVKKLEVETKKAKKGEMGDGVVSKLIAFLVGSGGPFTRLAEALVRYVENMRSDIRLVNEKGEELIISAKLNKVQIAELIDQFFVRSAKPRAKPKTLASTKKTTAIKAIKKTSTK